MQDSPEVAVVQPPAPSFYEQAGSWLGEAVPYLGSHRLLGNTLAAWVVAAAAVTVLFLLLSAIRGVLLVRAKALLERRPTPAWDLVLRLVMKTSVLIIAAGAITGGVRGLDLPGVLDRATSIAVIVLVGLQAAIWATVVVDWALVLVLSKHAKTTTQAAETTLKASMAAVRFLALLAVYSLVTLIALDNLGVDVTALITGMGIGGIAVALAAQRILGDVFGSLSITFDKPFEVGDFIVVGDFRGTVETIGIKTTRLRALSGEQVVLANSDLLASRIQNFKRMTERRCVFAIGVTYQTPLEKVAAIPGLIREAIESQPNTRFDRAHFQKFGASSLDYEAVYFMKVPDYNAYMDTQQRVNLILAERLRDMGVDFAYPTQTLYVVKQDAAS
ncbi:MAG: hypothetical protein HBSAPP03_13100 [Phycisphaerae bacterium]|nr:MAG: hypothetical protein HBSAPP03_13100 [Phycisphaerae bacterium]